MQPPRALMSTADLLRLGQTPSDLRRLVRSGALTRVRRGVYAWSVPDDARAPRQLAPHARENRHRELLLATLPTLQPGTAVSHVSAGLWHGLPVPLHALDRVTTLRDGSGQGVINATTHLRRSRVPDDHLELTDGGALRTTLERTAVDLARTLPFRDALAVVDAALRKGATPARLEAALLPRMPGNSQARSVLALGDGRSESAGESRCRATMHLAHVPLPDLQVRVVDAAGHEVARCDFGWSAHGLVGEFDGMVKYGRLLRPGQSVDDVIRDEKRREARILQQGLWVARWVTPDLGDLHAFRRGFFDSIAAAGRRAS